MLQKNSVLLMVASLLFALPAINAQCIRHISHDVENVFQYEEGTCQAEVEICIQKLTVQAHYLDLQINHFSGYLHTEFKINDYSVGAVICHTFSVRTHCNIDVSLTAYGRTAQHQYCGVWSTLLALPLDLISFEVHRDSWKNCASWKVENQVGVNRYELQVEKDKNFVTIGSVAANDKRELTSYSLCDETPTEVAVYRLKIIEDDGRVEYSNLVSVKANNTPPDFLVFPSPAQDFINIFGAEGELKVSDLYGRIVLDHICSEKHIDISQLRRGLYIVIDSRGQTSQFVKQ